jgi:class 3 adenylate cyclase/tetratricopeptide (TPR) repeat protein
MSTSFDEQINQLKQTIADIEAQRLLLGDAAVEASLEPLHKKLAELEAQVDPSIEESPVLPTRQRKLVTLLYMDVVGSTAMTQHLDPEDTLEIMDNALTRLAEPIMAHGGHVTRYTGDGFKAVFGDPIAREDDPEQAIRAGLDVLEFSQSLAQELKSERDIENFQVRIGIDTGLAALGGQTEADDTVMGRVVNMAVRIESAAPPGGLLISQNTYRHVRGVFTVEPQEPITAKGFPATVPVYLVNEIKPRAFRVQTRGVEGVETRMVGRRTELDTLKDALHTVFEEGEGQVITISGEAGVGKSRLLYEFQNWFELLPPSEDVFLFQGRGRQEAQGLPYSLLRDVFAFRFQILDNDTGVKARRKIEAGFVDVFGSESEGKMRAHILGQLFGFDFSASSHLKGVLNDAEQLRNRGLMYLKEYFQTLSQESPIVILLEDIHWADDSSLDVIMSLGEQTPKIRVLVVCAARPTLFEKRPYWGEGQAFHTLLELRPLTKRESRQLITEILKMADEIPIELRELIISGAEGNPFYTEELIKMLIEDGVIIPEEENWRIDLSRLEQVDVPSTLAGVLQARLDSLPLYERTVLQQASVVGRLFWDRIVSYIQSEGGNGGDPHQIPHALTSLRNRELVYRHEESAFVGTVEYLFKHDVLREVTYESVIKRLRKTYHGLVADWLIANGGDRIGEYSGLIAEHLLIARKNERACEYFSQAGDIALNSYANTEAEGFYRQALNLPTQESQLAYLLTGLGETLKRQGKNDEAKSSWQQAIDLYKVLGDSDRMADVHARFSRLLWDWEGYTQAWKVCQEGLELMSGAPDSSGYARLLAEAGRMAWLNNINDEVKPLCQHAYEMAERLGEKEVAADARITLALVDENITNANKEMEEVVDFAEENNLFRAAARAHGNLCNLQGEYLVNIRSAKQHTLRSIEISEQMGEIGDIGFAMANLCEPMISLGELDQVERLWIEFFSGPRLLMRRNAYYYKSIQIVLLLGRGKWNQAIKLNLEIKEDLKQSSFIQSISNRNLDITRAVLELCHFGLEGNLSLAESALEENIKLASRQLQTNFLLVEVYLYLRRISAAQEQFIRAQNDISPSSKDNNLYRICLLNAEIALALTGENWDQALNASRSSIDIYKNCSHRWGWARRLIDLGDALVGRDEPGDLELARETYQQSLDMFTEMGAPGYIKVLEERLGELTSH